MGLLDLLLVAVGLSMDAFAVSVCKGLNTKIVGYTVLLCFSLFKTSSVTKSVLGAH